MSLLVGLSNSQWSKSDGKKDISIIVVEIFINSAAIPDSVFLLQLSSAWSTWINTPKISVMASYTSIVSAFLLASSAPLAWSVPLTSNQTPFFGNLKGNNQPTKTSTPGVFILATGGQVNDPNAVTTINNQDGGACVDSYTQYCGSGSSYPPKSSWCNFEDMYAQFAFRTYNKLCGVNDRNPGSTITNLSCSLPATNTAKPTIPDQRLGLFTTPFSRSQRKPRSTTALSLPLSCKNLEAVCESRHRIMESATPAWCKITMATRPATATSLSKCRILVQRQPSCKWSETAAPERILEMVLPSVLTSPMIVVQ